MSPPQFAADTAHGIGAGILLLLTIFPFLSSTRSILPPASARNRSISDKRYEDKDGIASADSERQFSAKIPCFLFYVSTLSGVCISLAIAVVSSSNGGEVAQNGRMLIHWIQFVAWILIALQALGIYLEPRPVEQYKLALNGAISHIVVFILVCIDGVYLLYEYNDPSTSATILALAATTLALSVIGMCAGLAVPRRPELYYNGKPVDSQYTGSTLDRISFAWANVILRLAKGGAVVRANDLPIMDHHTRSKDLHVDFQSRKTAGSLLNNILIAHWATFILHYVVTFFQSMLQITPQIVMYNLLRVLEARDRGASTALPAALWTVGLGLAMLVTQACLESWMWWIGYGQLQIPIRVQLSALIFTKSLRRKEVKGATKKTNQAPTESNGVDTGAKSINSSSSDTTSEGTPDDPDQKTRQGTINLVGVDARRIAEFAVFGNLIFGSAVKLTFVLSFLGTLIGWQALLAGIVAQLLTIPLNMWASNAYTQQGLKLMKKRDEKLVVLTEALSGIRQIKFAALEQQWAAKIKEVRDQELHSIWVLFCYDTVLIFLWILAPVMLAAVSLAVYAAIQGSLSPSVAFTTIATLTSIELALSVVPEIITRLIDARVSLGRIETYLDSPEKADIITSGDSVRFENAKIAWPSDDTVEEDDFKLNDLNITLPTGELSLISGRTGSGKSLLLAAILGEVELLSGKIIAPKEHTAQERHDHKANKANWLIPAAIAFVSQQPWIENCTFKDNVLFGLPLDEDRYKKVIFACAMEKDLEMLTDGDSTEIGANGVNLSGGQRWRITLARALYSRAGVLVLDDVLSAIDAHVGRHIFEHAITGELAKGRTRILVTHHVSLCLPKTNYEVQLGDGRVDFAGPVDDFRRADRMEQILEEEQAEEAIEDDEAALLPDLQHVTSRSSRGGRTGSRSPSVQRRRKSSVLSTQSRRLSTSSTRHGGLDGDTSSGNAVTQPRKFVEEESKEQGRVKWRIYAKYLNAAGGTLFWTPVAAIFILYQIIMLGRSWWVAVWTESYKVESASAQSAAKTYASLETFHSTAKGESGNSLWFYLSIYLVISAVAVLEGPWRYFAVYWGSIRAGCRLFDELTNAVLRAPLRWLDTVPQGRILNRFTSDFASIDVDMAICLGFLVYNVALGLGILVAGMTVSPYVLILGFILLAVSTRYAAYYLQGARETKRLESILKSPIFDLFGATLSGITTIRAFNKSEAYERQMFAKIDSHASAYFYMVLFSRWLTFRLDIVGIIFTVATSAVIVSVDDVDASLAGFALGFVLQYADATSWIMRNYSMVELGMNAVERVVEYAEITIEDQGGANAPAAWPTEGRLDVTDLVVGYAPDLPSVLKGLSFDVKSHERVGVVGRTGAGKSSLTLALFRFLEAREGSIYIDGLDISKITLHDLRSRLAIIPQDPVLFSGTVRSNLDPFHDHSDYELEGALERVQLRSSSEPAVPSSSSPTNAHANINVFDALDSPISEGGSNLSQGQRQLLCLARAIVARPKVMVLDEATSAVDKATDALIQRSIREEFRESTLIVIAHRLSTIADFDRILVMSDGRAVEYDSPGLLMGREGGVFRGMLEDSGEEEVLRDLIFGNSTSE